MDGRDPSGPGWTTAAVALVALAGVGSAFWALPWALKPRGPRYCDHCSWPGNATHRRAGYPSERSVDPRSLKILASAQADFRSNDRDGNGVHDFWRKDVAGLYSAVGPDGKQIRLIERAMAAADAAPSDSHALPGGTVTSFGYQFKAIPLQGEVKPDPQRFAFCSIPVEYPHHGRRTFIIDHECTVYAKDLGHGRGVAVYPADPFAEGWSKID